MSPLATNRGKLDGGNGFGYGIQRELFVQMDSYRDFPADEAGGKVTGLKVVTAPTQGTAVLIGSGEVRYTPSPGFKGFDEMTIEYGLGTAKKTARILFDVGPCQRKSGPSSSLPQGEHTHIVTVEGAEGAAPRLPGTISVTVRKTARPVTLLLNSRATVTWSLKLETGAAIEKIIVQNFSPDGPESGMMAVAWSPIVASTVQGQAAGTPISYKWIPYAARAWENLESGVIYNFKNFIRDTRQNLGGIEASFQGCLRGKAFTVPYTQESLKTSCHQDEDNYLHLKTAASHYNYLLQSCAEKCGLGTTQLGQAVWQINPQRPWLLFSEDFLAVSNPHGNQTSGTQTNIGRSCGRFYFEVTKGQGDISTMAVGLGFNGHQELPIGKGNQHMAGLVDMPVGGVVGFAIDFDRGFMFVHRGGNYAMMSQDFANGVGAAELPITTYEPLHVVTYGRGVNDTVGMTNVIGNFGGDLVNRPFVYPVPPGFERGF